MDALNANAALSVALSRFGVTVVGHASLKSPPSRTGLPFKRAPDQRVCSCLGWGRTGNITFSNFCHYSPMFARASSIKVKSWSVTSKKVSGTTVENIGDDCPSVATNERWELQVSCSYWQYFLTRKPRVVLEQQLIEYADMTKFVKRQSLP